MSANVAIPVLMRPVGGQTYYDAAAGDVHFGRYFDEQGSPSARLTFAQRIAPPPLSKETPALPAIQRFVGHFGRKRRCGDNDPMTQTHEQVMGLGMQIETKEIGHEAVVAGAVHVQTALEFLVAIFGFTTHGVIIVGRLG